MPGRLQFKLMLAALALALLSAAAPEPVRAHAFLESSDPAEGAILPQAPADVRLVFSERLEPDATRASLYDHLGNLIEGTSYRIGAENELVLSLPTGLPNGTYSVVWSNISSDDGHPARGYVPFTIGAASDIRPILLPAALDETGGAPDWLSAGSRWLAFSGLLLTLAIWPVWSIVIAPPLRRRPREMRIAIHAIGRLAIAAFALALIGNVAALGVQSAERDEAFLDALRSTLFETRFGDLWLLRVLLLGMLAALLGSVSWTRPGRRPFLAIPAYVASFALVVPFSLNAHASAQRAGRTFAIAADMVHLVAAGLWAGGAVILAVVLWRLRGVLPGDERRPLLANMIPSFSFIAIAAWILLLLTGIYAAWLQIGSLDAARATSHGNAFLIKLAIAAILLGFGVTQFAIVSRRLADAAAGARWSRRLEAMLAAELVGIVAILLVTGWLTAQPPARDAVAQERAGVDVTFSSNELAGQLQITPGEAGPNHLRFTFADASAPADAVALLRLTAPEASFGVDEIELIRVGGNIWEAHGSHFSLAGDWTLEAIVRKPGEYQWQATANAAIGEPGARRPIPSAPWRFERGALLGIAMLVIGAAAAGRALTVPRGRARAETAGIAAAGLVLGLLFVLQARIDEPPAASAALADDATIARGAAIYMQQCLACHGVTGQGDGPQAPSLPVPPADFTDPLHQLHSDESLAAMIVNGFPAAGMPAFGAILNDAEIADVVAYLRSLGAGLSGVEIPEASDCTVEPRDPAALIAAAARPDALSPPTLIEWPQGVPANDGERAALTETVRQFVACTNAGDYARILGLSTAHYLAPRFAALDDAGREAAISLAAQPPAPLADGERIGIRTIEDVRRLDDGRLAAHVVTIDPVNHPHAIDVILILAEEDGRWRIDEIRLPPAAEGDSVPVATWPLTVIVEGYAISLAIADPREQGQPVRVTLRDATGASIDGATVTAILAPLSVGIPAEAPLVNVDPGTYFAYVPPLLAGTWVAEIEIVLPDGASLTAGFTFAIE